MAKSNEKFLHDLIDFFDITKMVPGTRQTQAIRLESAQKSRSASGLHADTDWLSWSGRHDSNVRPFAPKANALPGCATPRRSPYSSRRRKPGPAHLPPGRAKYASMRQPPHLPWLEPGSDFPPVEQAWGPRSDAPGLLAAGGDLSVETLVQAYAHGIFPWYSTGQPILWWSTDPRMVLQVSQFRLHRSLAKTLQRFAAAPSCEVRIDSAFADVLRHCANSPRQGQHGTWILPEMQQAYLALHRAGHAHSVETWVDGELVGGLYCVALGRAVYGESMFARATDASKIALAALVGLCRHHGVRMIDCQQNTAHLASLGAAEIPRVDFLRHIALAQKEASPDWKFSPLYWGHL